MEGDRKTRKTRQTKGRKGGNKRKKITSEIIIFEVRGELTQRERKRKGRGEKN